MAEFITTGVSEMKLSCKAFFQNRTNFCPDVRIKSPWHQGTSKNVLGDYLGTPEILTHVWPFSFLVFYYYLLLKNINIADSSKMLCLLWTIF